MADLQSTIVADTLFFLADPVLLTGGVRFQNTSTTGYSMAAEARMADTTPIRRHRSAGW